MKIQCAIFDFDGTLFDSMAVWDEIGEIYLHSLGKEPRPSLREDVSAMSLYQSAAYIKKSYELPFSIEEIITGINQLIADFYMHEVLPKPGVEDFLEQMKGAGIPMCIATATDRQHIEAALSRCRIAQYFDTVFTCNEVGHGKDEPIIFQKAMDYFSADRRTSLVFEDALHAIQTAKTDGFIIVSVFDKTETHQSEIRKLSDCHIEDFRHTDAFWQFALA